MKVVRFGSKFSLQNQDVIQLGQSNESNQTSVLAITPQFRGDHDANSKSHFRIFVTLAKPTAYSFLRDPGFPNHESRQPYQKLILVFKQLGLIYIRRNSFPFRNRKIPLHHLSRNEISLSHSLIPIQPPSFTKPCTENGECVPSPPCGEWMNPGNCCA